MNKGFFIGLLSLLSVSATSLAANEETTKVWTFAPSTSEMEASGMLSLQNGKSETCTLQGTIGLTDKSTTWEVTASTQYGGGPITAMASSERGFYVGSQYNPFKVLTLKTAEFANVGKITAIIIHLNYNTSVASNVTLKVGNDYTKTEELSNYGYGDDYIFSVTFQPESTGEITMEFSNISATPCVFAIRDIQINYIDSDQQDSHLTLPAFESALNWNANGFSIKTDENEPFFTLGDASDFECSLTPDFTPVVKPDADTNEYEGKDGYFNESKVSATLEKNQLTFSVPCTGKYIFTAKVKETSSSLKPETVTRTVTIRPAFDSFQINWQSPVEGGNNEIALAEKYGSGDNERRWDNAILLSGIVGADLYYKLSPVTTAREMAVADEQVTRPEEIPSDFIHYNTANGRGIDLTSNGNNERRSLELYLVKNGVVSEKMSYIVRPQTREEATAVTAVEDETVTPVYYDLQGNRQPEGATLIPGLYIRVTNGKAEKLLLK